MRSCRTAEFVSMSSSIAWRADGVSASGGHMISGAHIIMYSKDVDADRAFFRDVLQFPAVDAGHGWLIFALPPAEVAMHPAEESASHELFLMCPDLNAVLASLQAKHVRFEAPVEARW